MGFVPIQLVFLKSTLKQTSHFDINVMGRPFHAIGSIVLLITDVNVMSTPIVHVPPIVAHALFTQKRCRIKEGGDSHSIFPAKGRLFSPIVALRQHIEDANACVVIRIGVRKVPVSSMALGKSRLGQWRKRKISFAQCGE
jgi:hypothetical protein